MPAASASTSSAVTAPSANPVVERLSVHAPGDRVFRNILSAGLLRAGSATPRPTRLDAAACTLARTLIAEDRNALALAFPRGRGTHPALLGLTLALWRHALPHVCGSVLVSTARGELSKTLRELRLDGSEFEELIVGRLVTENVPNTGGLDFQGNPRPPRKRPAMRPLDRGPRKRLSQDCGYLLFARPNTLPPVELNIITSMVVDTVGTAGPKLFARPDGEPDSWTRTWELNVAARRNQLWLGELEDPDFLRFCEQHSIPLVQFDWHLINALTAPDYQGLGRLTSAPLVSRARQRPAVAVRRVEDAERDYYAREAYMLLAKLKQRGGKTEEPEVIRTAYKLLGLLCRLPCTTQAYEMAAGGPYAESVERLWNSVDIANSSAFRGRKWVDAYKRYWDPIRSALRKLVRLGGDEDTCGKYEALIERIGEAQAQGEKLRVVCQTNAERAALKATLVDFDVDQDVVTVHSFGARFDYGGAADVVTLLFGPPPPWRSSILVSGEAGRVEVLCYPHEVARLRRRVSEAERDHIAENLAALSELRIGTASCPAVAETGGRVDDLPSYAVGAEDEPEDEFADQVPSPQSDLWQELIAQYGDELPDGGDLGDVDDAGPAVVTPYDGISRLVRFTDAPPVFFRADAIVDVLLDEPENDDESLTAAVPVEELEAGMTIAFLPGGHRSILDELLAAYDERLSLEAKMFEPMWRRALAGAIANHGVEGVAELTGRGTAAVHSWVRGRNVPQHDWRFKKLLEASGDEEAIRAQKPLWRYLTATRGPHRHIGKLNRWAIMEAASEERATTRLRELETYVGRDLEDLYDQVEPVTVMSVSGPVPVPLSHCGRYLPDDDPYLRSCS